MGGGGVGHGTGDRDGRGLECKLGRVGTAGLFNKDSDGYTTVPIWDLGAVCNPDLTVAGGRWDPDLL